MMTDSAQDKVVELLQQQNALQQQLIEAQKEIIRLQAKIDQLTPKKPDNDVHWHKTSNGLSSGDVLASNNLELIHQLNDWIFQFGEKYIKPYVHLEAYGEMIAHMTRDIPNKLAKLETEAELNPEPKSTKKTSKRKTKPDGTSSTAIPMFPPEKPE